MACKIIQTASFIDFSKSTIEYGPNYNLSCYSARVSSDCRKDVEEHVSSVY